MSSVFIFDLSLVWKHRKNWSWTMFEKNGFFCTSIFAIFSILNISQSKQKLLKKWTRELENRTEPMVKLIDQLHGFLTTDMVKAVGYLGEVVQTLQAYAEARPRPVANPPTEAVEEISSSETGEPLPQAASEPNPSEPSDS